MRRELFGLLGPGCYLGDASAGWLAGWAQLQPLQGNDLQAPKPPFDPVRSWSPRRGRRLGKTLSVFCHS